MFQMKINTLFCATLLFPFQGIAKCARSNIKSFCRNVATGFASELFTTHISEVLPHCFCMYWGVFQLCPLL